jgi:hypothetical protein
MFHIKLFFDMDCTELLQWEAELSLLFVEENDFNWNLVEFHVFCIFWDAWAQWVHLTGFNWAISPGIVWV